MQRRSERAGAGQSAQQPAARRRTCSKGSSIDTIGYLAAKLLYSASMAAPSLTPAPPGALFLSTSYLLAGAVPSTMNSLAATSMPMTILPL